MIPYLKISNQCIKCDNCRLICPEGAILLGRDGLVIDTWRCTLCHLCVEICPVACIKVCERREGWDLSLTHPPLPGSESLEMEE